MREVAVKGQVVAVKGKGANFGAIKSVKFMHFAKTPLVWVNKNSEVEHHLGSKNQHSFIAFYSLCMLL